MRNFKLKILLIGVFLLTTYFLLPTAISASTIARPMHNSGLVGYWSFEEGSGSDKAYDRSGRGNHGTLTAMNNYTAWVNSSTTGTALNFDGADDFVQIAQHASINNLGPMTISAWVKPNSIGEGSQSKITVKGVSGLGANEWQLMVATTGSVGPCAGGPSAAFVFSIINSAAGAFATKCSVNSSVTFGVWQHVVITWDGTAGTNGAKIYKNGTELSYQASDGSEGGSRTAETGALYIGNRSDTARTFDGSIDEVRIYNRALSADEVSRLYKIQQPKVASGNDNTGLFAYWAFDEGVGTRAEDMSFNDYTGIVSGSPTWTSGRVGKTIDFDGSNDAITLPATGDYNVRGNMGYASADDFTLSIWYKGTDTAQNTDWGHGLISWNSSNFYAGLVLRSGFVEYIHYNGGWQHNIKSSTLVANSNWHHIVYVNRNNTGSLYIDGVREISAQSSTIESGFYFQSYNIGSSYDNVFTSGLIDEARIYSRALSAIEVNALYQGSKATVVNKTNKTNLRNGLVGHWTFDGKDIYSTTAFDSSGNNNRGTLTNGPAISLGKIGQALNFDNSDDYVQIAQSASLNDLGPMTISAWIKPNSIGEGSLGKIVLKGDTGIAANDWQLFLNSGVSAGPCNSTPTNVFMFQVQNSAGLPYATKCSANSSITYGDWQHIVLTWDGTGGTNGAKLYKNGTELSYLSSNGTEGGSRTSETGTLYIGNRGAADRTFDGSIDDVRIYNRVLSADEVYQLYNQGR